MSDEYEIANLRNRLDQILDPNYPNREEVLDAFSTHVRRSSAEMDKLKEKFERLYTGEKDSMEEFKLIVSATSLLDSGSSIEFVRDSVNKFLDVLDDVEDIFEKDEYSPTDEVKNPFGGISVDGLPKLKPFEEIIKDRLVEIRETGAVNANPPLRDIWGEREEVGQAQLDPNTLRSLKPGIKIKVTALRETFWCKVLHQLTMENYLCQVDNELAKTEDHGLRLHDKILVNARQIWEISW